MIDKIATKNTILSIDKIETKNTILYRS